MATGAVERSGALYAIQNEIRGRSPDERREVRQSRSRPLLTTLREGLEGSLAKLSKKSDTAAAIRYALARWDALVRFCEDGRIEIDNNAAERALRTVAIGRKDYLFAGSDRGGERTAALPRNISTESRSASRTSINFLRIRVRQALLHARESVQSRVANRTRRPPHLRLAFPKGSLPEYASSDPTSWIDGSYKSVAQWPCTCKGIFRTFMRRTS